MTARIRQFLVRLAGLGALARKDVVARHLAHVNSADYIAAETALAEVIERSGRTAERDALAGPLMQLLVVSPTAPDDAQAIPSDDLQLDPVAEPALAALLALLVSDLMAPHHVSTLTAPFADMMESA